MKRSISCFVALCLLFGTASLVGCPAPSDGGATATTTTSAAGGEPSAPSEPEFLDAVGEQDFGGAEMVISCFERYRYEVYAEEDSRDALDQLIFKRNEKLEERFHAKIVPDVTNMTGETDHGSHIEYLRTELAGMAPSFDMIAMYAYVSERTQLGKHLRNLRTAVPFVRESIAGESPWWPKIINAGSTVMGRQYVGVTDFRSPPSIWPWQSCLTKPSFPPTTFLRSIMPRKIRNMGASTILWMRAHGRWIP